MLTQDGKKVLLLHNLCTWPKSWGREAYVVRAGLTEDAQVQTPMCFIVATEGMACMCGIHCQEF